MSDWEIILSTVLTIVAFFVLAYMFFVISFYVVMLIISAKQLRKGFGLNQKETYEDILQSADTKPISVIVPAYNEEIGIYNSIRSLLSMNYPEYEVIVVNDGSKDKTLQVMIERFQMKKVELVVRSRLKTEEIRAIYQSKLHDNLLLIDKKNGGKADALNAGMNLSHYPYVCSLDGDSVLERDAFLKVMKPIIDSNQEVIATGGSIRIANGCKIERGELMSVGLSKRPLVIMQVIEYLRAFLMGRVGLSRHNLLLIVSGAFGVFHKESVIKAGGYLTNTVGEDMELVVRLHRLIKEEKSNERIVYVPDPVCWTEAPEDLAVLRRQRRRWHQGLFESLWLHKKMLFRPKYGKVGFISLPYFLFVELLGPIVEFLGYLIVILGLVFGVLNIELALLLFTLAFLYGSLLSMSAVLLEEWSLRKYPEVMDVVRLFFYALTEAFWYRPITVFWRLEGFIHILRKKKDWGDMTRKGISS
ncbi:glycosyltransferase family 2 protein [Alkalihalobacterium sp. APHAB7]|uniref:glycosyltransferase family 2 protein n=1 Tax=Alkalihalobacterium sp. APHAB7 TaxID=3402081 RepID=UPI003AAE9BB6